MVINYSNPNRNSVAKGNRDSRKVTVSFITTNLAQAEKRLAMIRLILDAQDITNVAWQIDRKDDWGHQKPST